VDYLLGVYSIANKIYGYPITDEMHKEFLRLEGVDEKEMKHAIAYAIFELEEKGIVETTYSGSAERTPAWVGVFVDAISEAYRESPKPKQVTPSQIKEAKKLIAEFAKLYPSVAALAPDRDEYIVWSTS
jgi:hypothetical protein